MEWNGINRFQSETTNSSGKLYSGLKPAAFNLQGFLDLLRVAQEHYIIGA